jgi:hypothetical protein
MLTKKNMKKQISLSQSVFWVALVTAVILFIPLVAMQFTNEVNWSVSDFVVMGILVFATGFSYMLLIRSSSNIIYRAAVTLAVGSTFLLIWANLAVGLIGSGANADNLMYAGIVAIVIIGTFLSRFTAKKMERVMFIAAITLILFAGIQLLAKIYQYPGSSVTEIIGVNTFFATLFAVAGLLFRYVNVKDSSANK